MAIIKPFHLAPTVGLQLFSDWFRIVVQQVKAQQDGAELLRFRAVVQVGLPTYIHIRFIFNVHIESVKIVAFLAFVHLE